MKKGFFVFVISIICTSQVFAMLCITKQMQRPSRINARYMCVSKVPLYDKNVKDQQLLKDRIFYTITDNLYGNRDMQTWQIEVQGLIKKFPQEETAIYTHIQNLIEKHAMYDVISRDSSVAINLIKCALLPGFGIATCSAGVQSFWFTSACTMGHVGETILEKAGYFLVGVPCAWSATGILALFTHYLLDSIDFSQENKRDVIVIRKNKNILILRKLVEKYQEQVKNRDEKVE